jgi:uncharacterized protein YabN with tetrapyrrole methylase and pyrophosphatase domain
MAKIIVVGVGPGAITYLTKEVEAELLRADKIVFRTGAHPVYEWLRREGKHLVCFDKLYDTVWTSPGDIYEFMVAALFKEAVLRGEAVYAVPGSPDVLEETTNLIRVRGERESRGASAARRELFRCGAWGNQTQLFRRTSSGATADASAKWTVQRANGVDGVPD